jgi:hypothetical protein
MPINFSDLGGGGEANSNVVMYANGASVCQVSFAFTEGYYMITQYFNTADVGFSTINGAVTANMADYDSSNPIDPRIGFANLPDGATNVYVLAGGSGNVVVERISSAHVTQTGGVNIYTSSTNINLSSDAEAVLVGGGGGGGASNSGGIYKGGGGGGGGYITKFSVTSGNVKSLTIGSGGGGGGYGSNGATGGTSTFEGFSAAGGGGGTFGTSAAGGVGGIGSTNGGGAGGGGQSSNMDDYSFFVVLDSGNGGGADHGGGGGGGIGNGGLSSTPGNPGGRTAGGGGSSQNGSGGSGGAGYLALLVWS